MLPIEQLEELIQGQKGCLYRCGRQPQALHCAVCGTGRAGHAVRPEKEPSSDFGDYADTLRRLNVSPEPGRALHRRLSPDRTSSCARRATSTSSPSCRPPRPPALLVTSEVELFFAFCPCEIVAVTGSDGKTTTTTLISKMFEAAGRKVFLGGNIGAALLPQLADVTPDAVAVVELSSFQLISMRRSPKVAVVTNVTPNHLDHHKDMQEYIDAKRNILLWQAPPCRAVLGYENDVSRSHAERLQGRAGLVHPPARDGQRRVPAGKRRHALLCRERRGDA